MKTISLNDTETEALFVSMFKNRNLIPIFGTGFTKGESTTHSRVPDATEFKDIMLNLLVERVGPEAEYLREKNFSEIAEYFLNPKFVPIKEAKGIIRKHFIGVKLSTARINFLQCPWPYIYTLNIDDAIETNSSFKHIVIPNKTISETAKNLPCVYKVHGDAANELIYDEPSIIIFSTGQYVRSLMTNMSMLNALKTDMTEQNTLFVGCSLNFEIDLLYALSEYHGTFPTGRLGIFVTIKSPNMFEKEKLSNHGINTILLVPDYGIFYETISKWGHKAHKDSKSLLAAYSIQRVEQPFKNDRMTNLSFLLRDPAVRFNRREAIAPDFYIHRNIESKILNSTDKKPLTIVRGRRFCGKTLLLKGVASSAKSRSVFLFESTIRISTEILDEISNIQNGLFIFDTNVFSPDTAFYLTRLIDSFKRNGSASIIALNRTESQVYGMLAPNVDDDADFELEHKLSPDECLRINQKLDALGILKLNCKKSILDNTFDILEKYPRTKSELSQAHDINEGEVEVLLVAAIADKAYSSLAAALNLGTNELFYLCDKLAPIIEIIQTTKTEIRDTNSRYKIVINSEIGIALQIRNVATSKGYPWLAARFAHVVQRLKVLPKFEPIAHSMYMFDAINHILSQTSHFRERSGFRPVVRALYEHLQPILNESPDYWLQRAKAVLNLEDDKDKILEGIEFAIKSYNEASRLKTIDNSEFQIALLYGKLCYITDFLDFDYIQSAVSWFSKAIRNYNRNPQYVQSMLASRYYQKNWFHEICDFFARSSLSDARFLPIKNDISFLLHIRETYNMSQDRRLR